MPICGNILKKLDLTATLVLTIFITCFGSSLLMGYNLAVLNLPEKLIQEFFKDTIFNGVAPDEKNVFNPVFLHALANSVFVIGAAIGAFGSGWLCEKLGRRNTLLFNHLFAILGSILCSLCVIINQPVFLFTGRFLFGLNSGMTIGSASLYLMEIAPCNLRGSIGACHQLAVTIGIALAYLLTAKFAMQTKTLWPVATGFCIFPAVVSLASLPFLPESPRFLFMNKHNKVEASKAFIKFNSNADVDKFIEELENESSGQDEPDFKFYQLFTQKSLRMPVLIACMIQVLQQFSGINAVVNYSSAMIRTAGVSEEYIDVSVILIGVLNIVMTILSLYLIERFGRRTLLFVPTVALAISLVCLTISVKLVEVYKDTDGAKPLGILSVVFILFYIASFAPGLGPVPAMIVSEIFRQGPRASAYSLSQSIQWLCNLLVSTSYPSINLAIGGFSFLPFLAFVIPCLIFFFLYMPETRNRTFDEVANDLALGNIVVGKHATTLENPNLNVINKSQSPK